MNISGTEKRPLLKGIGLWIGPTLIAFAIRWLLDPYLDTRAPYLFFFLSTLVSARLAGLIPGLLSVALGAVLGMVSFVSPKGLLALAGPQEYALLAAYVVVSSAAAWLTSALRDARTRVWQAESLARSRSEELERGRKEITLTRERIHEQATWDSEQRFREMADAAPVMIWMTNPERQCVWVNKTWLDFTGRTLEGQLGSGWVENVPAESRQEWLEAWHTALDKREPFELEFCLRRHDGEIRWVLGRGTPHRVNAIFRGHIGTCLDVTERKSAEEALAKRFKDLSQSAHVLREQHQVLTDTQAELESRVRERTAELEAANRELEAFSYSVSHDLRAPLRSISGFSRAVLEDYGDRLDEQGAMYLRYAHEAALRMSRLIDDLLAFSRFNRQELRKQEVDLSALAEGILKDLQTNEPQRQVSCDVTPHLTARGDEALLRIALQNLLQNAWKFTSKGAAAKIELGAKRQDGKEVFFVRDNGAGFDMEHAERLFGVFQRLHSNEEFPGTGVGLATVKRILHRHGGSIWAEAKENRGATFYFTLPNGAD